MLTFNDDSFPVSIVSSIREDIFWGLPALQEVDLSKSSLTSLPERILENIATFVKFSCRLCNSFVEFKPNTFVNSKSANAIDITVVKDAGGSVFLPEGVCSKDFQ
jgi:hypothetical protein